MRGYIGASGAEYIPINSYYHLIKKKPKPTNFKLTLRPEYLSPRDDGAMGWGTQGS